MSTGIEQKMIIFEVLRLIFLGPPADFQRFFVDPTILTIAFYPAMTNPFYQTISGFFFVFRDMALSAYLHGS